MGYLLISGAPRSLDDMVNDLQISKGISIIVRSTRCSYFFNSQSRQRILRESFSIDKKMLLAMKKASFPTHTDQLHQIKSSTLVMGGEGKVISGVDERKGSQTIFNHIHNAKLALFKNAFDPLSTMRRDIMK